MNTNFLSIVQENEIFDIVIMGDKNKCYINKNSIYLHKSNVIIYKHEYIKCECCWLKENHLTIFCCEEDHFNNKYHTINCIKIIDYIKCRDCNKICCHKCINAIFEYNGIKTIHINKELKDISSIYIFNISILIKKNYKKLFSNL